MFELAIALLFLLSSVVIYKAKRDIFPCNHSSGGRKKKSQSLMDHMAPSCNSFPQSHKSPMSLEFPVFSAQTFSFLASPLLNNAVCILAASKFLLPLSFLRLSLSKKPTFPSMNSSHLLHHLNTPRFLTSSISSLCHVLTHSQLRRNCLHPGLGTIVSSQTMFQQQRKIFNYFNITAENDFF